MRRYKLMTIFTLLCFSCDDKRDKLIIPLQKESDNCYESYIKSNSFKGQLVCPHPNNKIEYKSENSVLCRCPSTSKEIKPEKG